MDLGARNLEDLVLPPEGTWSNDSQLEINCFADCQKEAKILGQDQDGKRRSNQLSRGAQEINDPVYCSLITCFMQSYDNCVLGGGES